MATLTNTKIKDTYDGLLKTTTNDVLGASGVTLIEDGLGNASAISIGRANNGVTITGAVTATSIVKTGGTSSQFLKADGSIDSNTYLTSESDTLDSVTDRGASTTNAITIGGLTSAGYTYPTSGGTSGQAIVTDGAGNLSFATVTSPTPTLQQVTTAGASTTNSITVGGLTASGLSYPSADGNAGQVLATNGSGTLGFINVSSGGGDLDDVLAAGNESTREAIVGAITVKGGTTNAGMKMWQGNSGLAANLGIGYSTLSFVTTGTNNTVIGGDSGLVISSGGQNVALGNGSLSSLTTSSRNVAIGYNSLFHINGNDNVAVGQRAGTDYYDGVTLGNKTSGTQNIYIGTGVRSAAANTTNEMVFGYGATGNGSNTATYGNSSITDHIFTSGNVGIGTDSPQHPLHIHDPSAVPTYLHMTNASTGSSSTDGTSFIVLASGDLYIRNREDADTLFFTDNIERMRIDSSGKVIIKNDSTTTSSPALRLDANPKTSWTVGDIVGELDFYTSDGSGNAPYSTAFIQSQNETGGAALPSGALVFGTATYNAVGGATERMRIDSSGNVGINKSPENFAQLEVKADTNGKGALLLDSNASTQPAYTIYEVGGSAGWEVGMRGSTNSYRFAMNYGDFSTLGNEKFQYTSAGQAYNSTGTWGTISSDERLKENIIDATSKLQDILSLNVKNYNYIGNDEKYIGFIAQEFEQVFPSLVTINDTRDYDEEGNVVSGYEDTRGLKVGMDFAILVKAMQEQQEIINDLKARIETLEAK